MAQESEAHQHTETLHHLKSQSAALDSAFDADVRLAGSGELKKPDGTVVELSPEWITSARKGYIAARDLLSEQVRLAEVAHATRRDNLRVADESLEMASHLIIQQWNVTEQLKQHVLSAQRRFLNDR
jgi:hypothetical protein